MGPAGTQFGLEGEKARKAAGTFVIVILAVACLALVLPSGQGDEAGVWANSRLVTPFVDFKSKRKGYSGRFEPRGDGHTKDCMSKHFAKETLKLVKESTIISTMIKYAPPGKVQEMVNEVMLIDKYEASDIIATKDGSSYLIVFDNSFRVGYVERGMMTSSHGRNGLLEWPNRKPAEDDDSQFEAITYNKTSDTYFFVQETSTKAPGETDSVFHEVRLNPDKSLETVQECRVDMTFSSENKGIEGAAVFYDGERSVILAMCEGNYCEGGKRGREAGNGRILVLEKDTSGGSCVYHVVQTVHLPKSVDFVDYSSISLFNNRKIAVSSQENSAVWIAEIKMIKGEVVLSKGKIFDFPRNDNCEIVYCNIEGIFFEGEDILVAVSDKIKGKGKQPYICQHKGQMMHAFVIPQ